MEPVKFDKNIRKQLAKREIKPSADSWEKLQEKLEQQEEKRRPTFWWIGIAAAVVGIVFFAGTFFNAPVIKEDPVMVNQDFKEILQQDKPINTSQKVEKAEPLKSDAASGKKPKVLKKGQTKPDLIDKMKARTRIANVEVHPKGVHRESIPASESIAMSAPNDNRTTTAVTDAEIEALLQEAQRTIEKDSSLPGMYAVNPEELLDHVEYELEEGFREKVFEALKEGFSKAKTAVANRNF